MYLLDSNALITAKNSYYQMNFCPAFWDWLDYEKSIGKLGSIMPVYKELIDGDDELADWVKQRKSFFAEVSDEVVQRNYAKVAHHVNSDHGKHRRNRDLFLDKADPWLIAYAMTYGHTVITKESLVDINAKVVKIPNVCQTFDVEWDTTFNMLHQSNPQFSFTPPA